MSAKNLRLIARGETHRTLWRNEPTVTVTDYGTTKGYKTIETGIEHGSVELWADVDAIIEQLGRRALNNRERRARLLDGLIECRVIERRQVYKEGEPKK